MFLSLKLFIALTTMNRKMQHYGVNKNGIKIKLTGIKIMSPQTALKKCLVVAEYTSSGREFQMEGTASVNALLLNIVLVLDMM